MMQTYSRGEAIFKYLEIVLSLPMYAIHYYDVKVRTLSMLVTCVFCCVYMRVCICVSKVRCLLCVCVCLCVK